MEEIKLEQESVLSAGIFAGAFSTAICGSIFGKVSQDFAIAAIGLACVFLLAGAIYQVRKTK